MIKVHLVVVGKIKESFFREAVEEYEKRLTRFCSLDIRELPERRTIEEEAEDILRAAKGYIFALAVEGKACSSEQFAKKIQTVVDSGKELTFLIGSSYGLSEKVKEHANEKLSFSELTFPHQLMRVILLEQIYRAFMINSGSEYHK